MLARRINNETGLSTLLALCGLAVAASAQAATYTGTQNVGGETVQLSITTDGVIGIVRQANITDYVLTFSGPLGNGMLTLVNSFNEVYHFNGSVTLLIAKPKSLIYDFTNSGPSGPSTDNFVDFYGSFQARPTV